MKRLKEMAYLITVGIGTVAFLIVVAMILAVDWFLDAVGGAGAVEALRQKGTRRQ